MLNYCQHIVGIFLRHECRSIKDLIQCPQCGRTVCGKHYTSSQKCCHECAKASSIHRRNDRSFDSQSDQSSVGLGSNRGETWSGEGGGFSGGGASGNWSTAQNAVLTGVAVSAVTNSDESADFTDEDYAAFNVITSADKDEKASSYDS